MDRRSCRDLSRKEKEGSLEREAVELEEKEFFKKGKTHRDECNNQATQTKIQTTC